MVKRRAHSEPDRETNEDQGHNVGNRCAYRLTRSEAPACCKAAQLAAFFMSGLDIVTGRARPYGAFRVSQMQCPLSGAPPRG
jgi:hypothetical protein